MNPLAHIQCDRNAQSRQRWEPFRSHRERVTALLGPDSVSAPGRLCVLGAGNCNDLDLPTLLRFHREIHLVDLDGEALVQGVARQGLKDNPAVRCYGGLDVTGMIDDLAAWTPASALTPEDVAALVREPVRQVDSVISGPFDVVASTCLLSELVDGVVRAVSVRHPRFVELLHSVRLGHLHLLAHLLARSGTAILISDCVSSETFPALGSVPDDELPATLARLIREGNFFHGLNPFRIIALFRDNPILAREAASPKLLRPWRWDFGPRLYAVWAIRFRKAAGA